MDAIPTETCVAPVDAPCDLCYHFSPNESSVARGCTARPFFILFSFPCSADHERAGLATV